MAKAFLTLAGCLALGLAAGPGAAQDMPWPVRLRLDLDRVGQLEWRLREAAGNACPQSAADAGIVFDDRRAYPASDWPVLAKTLGMGGLPVVASVAANGPAQAAGVRVGDEVVQLGAETPDAIVARRRAGALVADALLDEIAQMPAGRPFAMVVRRDGVLLTLQVTPVQHCAARLVLVAKRGIDAYSDQRNAALTTGLVTFARNDDELAMAAGHELAHVINGDRRGGGIGRRRAMEDAADALGLRLLLCAGYDAENALTLFQRLGKRDWLGFLNAPTHRSYTKRVERLRAQPAVPQCPVVKE